VTTTIPRTKEVPNSEARKRAGGAVSVAKPPLSPPIPAPVDSGVAGRLSESERDALAKVARDAWLDGAPGAPWEHVTAGTRRAWIKVADAVLAARTAQTEAAAALREAASDPGLRLSGHSGISITRLRERADRIEDGNV